MANGKHVLLLALYIWIFANTPARSAGTPAGIVMEVTGETSPVISAMSEIQANVAVRLSPQAEVTFVHYNRCKLVTVVGGTLTLTLFNFAADGRIKTEKDWSCPRVHQLSGTTAGTVIMHERIGTPEPPELPVKPMIVFVGSRAKNVTAANISRKDDPNQVPVRLLLAPQGATLADATTSLIHNTSYVLHVTLNNTSDPIEFNFIARKPTGDQGLVVMRLD